MEISLVPCGGALCWMPLTRLSVSRNSEATVSAVSFSLITTTDAGSSVIGTAMREALIADVVTEPRFADADTSHLESSTTSAPAGGVAAGAVCAGTDAAAASTVKTKRRRRGRGAGARVFMVAGFVLVGLRFT